MFFNKRDTSKLFETLKDFPQSNYTYTTTTSPCNTSDEIIWLETVYNVILTGGSSIEAMEKADIIVEGFNKRFYENEEETTNEGEE